MRVLSVEEMDQVAGGGGKSGCGPCYGGGSGKGSKKGSKKKSNKGSKKKSNKGSNKGCR